MSPELIGCNFFPKILKLSFTPKTDQFVFFKLIKKHAEITLLLDEKIKSQEASYWSQQSSRRVESPKICIRENVFVW